MRKRCFAGKDILLFYLCVVIICLIIIVPFCIMTIYSRPCVDDYAYSVETYRLVQAGKANILSLIKQAWEIDKQFYNTWQGLYTSAFVLALQPGIFGEKYYFIGSLLLLLLIFICLIYFLNTLSLVFGYSPEKHIFAKGTTLVVSAGVLAYILIGLPDITEGIFWFNGAWNYTPFFFLILVNIALMTRFICFSRYKHLILASILSFLISGGNHVTAFLNILVLVFFVLVAVIIQRKLCCLLLPLFSALMGFWIMYRAPGTSARQSCFEQPSIKETLKQCLIELKNLCGSYVGIQWFVLLIAAIIAGKRLAGNIVLKDDNAVYEKTGNQFAIQMIVKHPLFLVIISVITMCGILCVPYYAMGNFGAGRVYNIFWLTFMALSFANSLYIVVYTEIWGGPCTVSEKSGKQMVAIAAIMLVIAFLYSGNYTSVIRELKDGTAESFAEVCDERYEKVRKASQGDVCYSPELPMSECLYVNDVTWDNSQWQNEHWTNYYGVSMVLE